MTKRMIFHLPWKVNKQYASATSIRPYKMIAAFEEIGYEVYPIMGNGAERHDAFVRLQQLIERDHIDFSFMYSESSTQPTAIASGKHDMIRYPLLDYRIFRYVHHRNIPIALFYRDIHWKFDELSKNRRTWFKYYFFLLLYRLDLVMYRQYVHAFSTPFHRMRDYVPVRFDSVFDLPAGCDRRELSPYTVSRHGIRIFYVGGFGHLYSMHALCEAVHRTEGVYLTLCIRAEDWERVKHEYAVVEQSDRITVVHASGDDLLPYYNEADILSFVLRPYEYLSITVPYKLYEYVSFGKPIITTKRTGVADFVEQNDVGWSVEYTADDLCDLFERLKSNPNEIERKRRNTIDIIPRHYWSKRAETVVNKVRNEG